MRAFVIMVVLAAVGWWMFGGSAYSRVVDRPPSEVATALSDLDIRSAPGAPGTDPTATGGIPASFTVTTAEDRVEYVVHANGEVATRMIAHLEPIDNGTRTKVWAEVVRGPAPDDYVSPAFRSEGTTLGLFAVVLEDELDKLVFKAAKWGPKCDEIMARFQDGNLENLGQPDPKTFKEAVARNANDGMSLSALDQELKTAGCPTNSMGNGF